MSDEPGGADFQEEEGARFVLFCTSILVGLGVGIGLRTQGVPPPIYAASGLVAALLNPLIAALFSDVCEALHEGAFPRSFRRWPTARRAINGAFWPIATVYWLIVFLFFGSINRLFPEEREEPNLGEKPKAPPLDIHVIASTAHQSLVLKDLKLTHPGCGGGPFEADKHETRLTCVRCHIELSIHPGEQSIGALCKTALDGQPRALVARDIPRGYSKAVVRQAQN